MSLTTDFYTEGTYLEDGYSLYCKANLTRTCPADGLLTGQGIYVTTSPTSKTAAMLSWSALLKAVAWAAKRSPSVRADLRRILAAFDPVAPPGAPESAGEVTS